MSGDSFDYHTFVDGKGYLFTLPALGLPDPKGEWIELQGAMTRNQLDTMDALSKAKAKASGKAILHCPASDCVTVDVEHQDALWLLPLLNMDGDADPQVFSVKVRRVMLPDKANSSGNAASQDPVANLAAQTGASLSISSPPPNSPAATRAASPGPSEASTLGCPLSPASTLSSALDNTTDDRNATARSSSSSDQDDSDSVIFSRLLQPRHNAPLAGIMSDEEVLGPLMKNFRYVRANFDWNYRFEPIVSHLKYVDTLPRGDPIPQELRQSHRQTGSNWAVDRQQGVLYHLPTLPLEARSLLWLALTKPSIGYPCQITNGRIRVNIGLQHDTFLREKASSSSALRPGPGLLKAVPLPEGYSCQPSAASSEVSFFLNRYQLIVQQGERKTPAYEPLASYVEFNEELFLGILGQCASAAANAAGKDAAMPFCQHPPPLIGMSDLLNVAVRLRDGGARFPVIHKGPSRKRLKMPGTSLWHGLYGDYGSMRKGMDTDKEREVNLRMTMPTSKQDIILRVKDVPTGKFDVLQYALRSQGSFKPVGEEEWKKVELRHLDDWAIEFFLNIARESLGIGERAVAE